jgi:chaperone required for assembly of F1-ATPase
LTALSGSLALALALAHKFLSVEAAWTAANLDEDFQMSVWGEDQEASARREKRYGDFRAAALLLDCIA